MFVSVGIELAKKGLAWYLDSVPSYATLYGAFATVPILLLWIYLVWVIVLLGAVVAAYAPSLPMRWVHRPATPGHRFELALAVLQQLAAVRGASPRGLSLAQLSEQLHTDALQLEPLVEQLAELDWVQRLDEGEQARLVLLCDPHSTPCLPLVDKLLLAPSAQSAPFRAAVGLADVNLAQAFLPQRP
jgi:membrane protein